MIRYPEKTRDFTKLRLSPMEEHWQDSRNARDGLAQWRGQFLAAHQDSIFDLLTQNFRDWKLGNDKFLRFRWTASLRRGDSHAPRGGLNQYTVST